MIDKNESKLETNIDLCTVYAFYSQGASFFSCLLSLDEAFLQFSILNGTGGAFTECSKCCDNDFCNIGLCGGGTPRNFLQCLGCSDYTVEISDCNRIEQCGEDEMCYAHRLMASTAQEFRYETGCRPRVQCQGIAQAPIINQCFECCDTPMCNLYKCGSNWTAVMHFQTTTSPAPAYTTLPTTSVWSLPPPHISGLMMININANTILSCTSSEPGVTYTWLYQGSRSLPLGVSVSRGNHLVIFGAKSSNVGTYTCVIYKNGHQAASDANVTIISVKAHVTSVVALPNPPQTGHIVDIHCIATGYPDPTIYWSYTDTMGMTIAPPEISYPDPRTVRINNFEPSFHGGTWWCIAINNMGVDRRSIQM
ncbi:hypothetical protein ACJMK2_025134 [Sinanodonta woodiana]|uniref:Ig-like domain-containing protein n=1 Tax=Sinanodonta woodiana TaxID=1069815 RepID=A0ABD3XG19_SINWO